MSGNLAFKSAVPLMLGAGLEDLITNYLTLKEMDTDKIVEYLQWSRENELENCPAINTKRLMCIQELIDRGEENRIFDISCAEIQ